MNATIEANAKIARRYKKTSIILDKWIKTNRPLCCLNESYSIVVHSGKLRLCKTHKLQKGMVRLLTFEAGCLVKGFSIKQWDQMIVRLMNVVHLLHLDILEE